MSSGFGVPNANLYGMLSSLGDDLAERRAREELATIYGGQLEGLAGAAPAAAPVAQAALGQSAPASVSSSLPAFARAQGNAPSANIKDVLASATQKYGLDPDYLPKLTMIESSGDPNAKNPSGASGLLQFMPKTARAYGLSNPFDPVASADAGARLTLDNKRTLFGALGRDPTNGELYLGHQQGAAGAAKLLTNPNARAADLVGVKAVVQNGGTPDMSAAEFARKWTSRFDKGGQTRTAQADMPVLGAKPIGFQVPGEAPAFEPGSVASPAIGGQQAQTQPSVPAPQRVSPQQSAQLKAMLASRSPQVQQLAIQQIQKLGEPEEFGFQVVGDQLIRTSKRGGAEAVGIAKPPSYQPVKGDDGNTYTFNPQTGEYRRALPGQDKQFTDVLSPDDRAAAGVPEGYQGSVQRGPDGQIHYPGKPATAVNIDQKGETAFAQGSNKYFVEKFGKISDEGDAGRTDMALLGQLRSLGDQVGTGGVAAVQGYLADKGIKLGDNVGAVEAYGAMIDRLTPAQRIPGAGATSDFDARMFKTSLPRLINTPEGNALIVNTLEALAQDRVARAAIAEKGLTGEVKPPDVVRELRALPSPNLVMKKGLSELQQAGRLGPANATPSGGAPTQSGLKAMPSGVAEQARKALSEGRDRDGVIAKLRRLGFDPGGL